MPPANDNPLKPQGNEWGLRPRSQQTEVQDAGKDLFTIVETALDEVRGIIETKIHKAVAQTAKTTNINPVELYEELYQALDRVASQHVPPWSLRLSDLVFPVVKEGVKAEEVLRKSQALLDAAEVIVGRPLSEDERNSILEARGSSDELRSTLATLLTR